MKIAFRPAVGNDVRYLKSTWLRSFRDGEGVRSIPNTAYYDYEDKILRYIIPRCSNQGGVLIAYEAMPQGTSFGDIVDQEIIGWICCEPLEEGLGLLLHFVYVRGFDKNGEDSGYRRRGVATSLLEHAQEKFHCKGEPITFTYRTPACWKEHHAREVLKRHNASYIPYAKFSLLPEGWETGRAPIE